VIVPDVARRPVVAWIDKPVEDVENVHPRVVLEDRGVFVSLVGVELLFKKRFAIEELKTIGIMGKHVPHKVIYAFMKKKNL